MYSEVKDSKVQKTKTTQYTRLRDVLAMLKAIQLTMKKLFESKKHVFDNMQENKHLLTLLMVNG